MTFGTSDTTAEQTTTTDNTKPVLTKEEKLAQIDKQIAQLQAKRYNVENDIVVVKAKKEVALPEVGAEVLFLYGRKTPTTSPVEKIGRVTAVKPVSEVDDGKGGKKKLPAQVKVVIGSGFDEEFVTIYPAQIITDAKASA